MGTIYTYTVVRRSMLPDFAASGPYVIAYVELEEGPRIMTNIVDCSAPYTATDAAASRSRSCSTTRATAAPCPGSARCLTQ